MWLTVIFQHTLMRPVSWLLKLTIQDSGRVLGRSTERAAAVEKGHCMFHGFTFCKRRRFLTEVEAKVNFSRCDKSMSHGSPLCFT